MFQLSCEWAALLQTFAPLFSSRVWAHAQALLLGAILAPGKRTVSSALRALGLSGCPHFQNFHRVLNRDSWSPRQAGRLLLGQLIQALAPSGPLVFGLDDTIERRWGRRIRERGIYRDAARSSKKVLNKTSGLRWLSAQLLAVVPFAGRVWGLPFLTLLAPSERYHKDRGHPHRKITQVAKDAIALVKRWAPKQRPLIFVGDSSYAALELLAWCQKLKAALIVPLRLDARLFHPAPPRKPGQKGRPPKKGKPQLKLKTRIASKRTRWHTRRVQWYGKGRIRVQLAFGKAVWYRQRSGAVPIQWIIVRDPLGRFETRALACSCLDLDPWQILEHYAKRWQMEVTFQEARTHLGFETQRQWNGLAIRRATPALLGLFSVVTLLAHSAQGLKARGAAWYQKRNLTFSDALAHVRAQLWQSHFCASQTQADMQKSPQAILQRFADLICYAQ